MRRTTAALAGTIALLLVAAALPCPAQPSLILATTTSTQDSGLLDDLLPRFEAATRPLGQDDRRRLRRGARDGPPGRRRRPPRPLEGGRGRVHGGGLRLPAPRRDAQRLRPRRPALRPRGDPGPFHRRRPEADRPARRPLRLARRPLRDSRARARALDEGGAQPRRKALVRRDRTGDGRDGPGRVREAGLHAGRPRHLPRAPEEPRSRDPRRGREGALELLPSHRREPGEAPEGTEKEAKRFAEWLVTPAVQKAIGEFGREKYGQPLFVPDAK